MAIFTVLSCTEKDEKLQEITDVRYLQNTELFNNSPCFSPAATNIDDGFMITNEQEYLQLADSLRGEIYNYDCDTATLADIDFDENTLLGILTGYGPCYDITRSVLKDETNRKIIYKIDFKRKSVDCPEYYYYIAYINLNAVLIPKIATFYEPEFRVSWKEH